MLGGCSPASETFTHDAYVWQRAWRQPVKEALVQSAPVVRAWHILVAQIDARGAMQTVAFDANAVAATQRPAIAVVRIEDTSLAKRHIDRIAALLNGWADNPQVIGLEIDHDAAAARLSDYAAFLGILRTRIDPKISLSITALPDWLDAPGFPLLLRQADEVVLQLHGIPVTGSSVFDAEQAQGWIGKMARFGKPYRIALPNYGSRILQNAKGALLGIESEQIANLPPENGREIFSSPGELAGFVDALTKRPHPLLRGIVWFRLPVDSDTRAWRRATWHAVLQHRYAAPRLALEFRATPGRLGAGTLVLANRSAFDGELPAYIATSATCSGTTQTAYLLETNAPDHVTTELFRAEKRLLRASQEIVVAQLECNTTAPVFHYEN